MTNKYKLELHAKTYYDDPRFDGTGDEHYITLEGYKAEEGQIMYSGTGWKMIGGQWTNVSRPLPYRSSIYVDVTLDQCIHPGFKDALLILTTEMKYFISRPSGSPCPHWRGSLSGTKYKLTELTC